MEQTIYNLKDLPIDESIPKKSLFLSSFSLPSLNSMSRKTSKTENITNLQLGDRIEVFFQEDGWFKGYLAGIYRNEYAVSFDDGDYQEGIMNTFVRPLLPYKVGEKVLTSDGEMGIIARIKAIGYVEVQFLDEDNNLFDVYHLDEIRRWE
jgi:hypothetical protein